MTAIAQTSGEYIHNPTGAIEEEFGEGNVTGVIDAENGSVKTLNGKLDKEITAVDLVDRCYEFFKLHKDLFGLDNPREELKVISVNWQFLGYKFRQFYDGIQVSHHRIKLAFTIHDKTTLTSFSGEIATDVKKSSSSPAISEDETIQIAIDAYVAQKK